MLRPQDLQPAAPKALHGRNPGHAWQQTSPGRTSPPQNAIQEEWHAPSSLPTHLPDDAPPDLCRRAQADPNRRRTPRRLRTRKTETIRARCASKRQDCRHRTARIQTESHIVGMPATSQHKPMPARTVRTRRRPAYRKSRNVSATAFRLRLQPQRGRLRPRCHVSSPYGHRSVQTLPLTPSTCDSLSPISRALAPPNTPLSRQIFVKTENRYLVPIPILDWRHKEKATPAKRGWPQRISSARFTAEWQHPAGTRRYARPRRNPPQS